MRPGQRTSAQRRVLVVDDRALVAQSLVASLQDLGFDALALPEPLVGIDVPGPAQAKGAAILALSLGGAAPALTRSLTRAGWGVIAIGDASDRLSIASCLEAGAAGFLTFDDDLLSLAGAVTAVHEGIDDLTDPNERAELLHVLRDHRTSSVRRLAPFERLTPREREVLAGLVEGLRADDIAASSFVSVTTVRNQIQSVLTKLDARSQLEAVAKARRADWTPQGPPPD